MIYFPAEYLLTIYSLPPMAEVRFEKDYFSEYPQQIRVGNNRSAVSYTRQPGYYAIHDNQFGTAAPKAILQLNGGAIAVFAGEPNQSQKNTSSPIYTLEPLGSPAVPTGLVFIRFAEGVNVESQLQAINQAGYAIEQTLPYAPHTAWLRHQSGNIANAIAGISQLEAIPNVESVEPQMLMERSFKLKR